MEDNRNTHTIHEDGSIGEVRIADDVVAVIAGLAATEVEGVASIAGNITNELVNAIKDDKNKEIIDKIKEIFIKRCSCFLNSTWCRFCNGIKFRYPCCFRYGCCCTSCNVIKFNCYLCN